MRSRSSVLGLVVAIAFTFIGISFGRVAPAHADAKSDIQAKITQAMENYDLFEYDAARKQLQQALALSKKAKLEQDEITAKVHLALGIVQYAGLQDEDAARLAFLDAAAIDPAIEIDAAYRTPEMAALLDEARAAVADTGNGGGPEVDCESLEGIEHQLVSKATIGRDLPMVAYVGASVGASTVKLHFRAKGKDDYASVPMTNTTGCKYEGAIPAAELTGDMAYYFIDAYDGTDTEVAQRGSEGSPNLLELVRADGSADTEDPNKPKGGVGGVVNGGKPSKVFIAVGIGSGLGYVTGVTEQSGDDVGCCVAPALLHFAPELGFALSPNISLSLVGRIGLTLGANIEGHAPIAPAVLVRLRYRPSTDGAGLHFNGEVGGGVMRNTIKLTDEVGPGMDTDIVGLGPLIIGAGVGYGLALGAGKTRLVADLTARAGLPVVDKLGTAAMNFGVELDASLGVQVGF